MDGYVFWTIFALAFFIIELFAPSYFFFLLIGSAALFTGLSTYLLNASWIVGVCLFVFTALLLLALAYKRYRSHWAPKEVDVMNNSLAQLIGSVGTISAIDTPYFKVRVGGYFWSAKKASQAQEIVLNSKVRIIGYENMTLLVELESATQTPHA